MFYYILIFNKLLLFSYVVSARNHHPRYKTEDQKTTIHHWSTTRWCTKERRRWAGHHQFMPTFLVHMPLPFPAPSLSRRQCCGCVSFSEFSPPCFAIGNQVELVHLDRWKLFWASWFWRGPRIWPMWRGIESPRNLFVDGKKKRNILVLQK